jgi:hypothetical protein
MHAPVSSRWPRVFVLAAILIALAGGEAAGARAPAGNAPVAKAALSSRYVAGIGDDNPAMFASDFWIRLHTKIVRYVVPYDAATHRGELRAATSFIEAAEAAHQRVLVAFYHSSRRPTHLPSVGEYRTDVRQFVRHFPAVREYEAWDESNRGYVPHVFVSPSAVMAARYYQALIRTCRTCLVVGLDVLDAQVVSPTLRYIAEFKHEIGRLKTRMPSVWGLHNYADLNHHEDRRTRQLTQALGGDVWLTETGGIVKFAGAFPNRHGSGLYRAAKVLKYMFTVTKVIPRIRRLYIYNWTGAAPRARWDSGLTNTHLKPRPGWVVVCHELHAAHCATSVSKT